MDDKLNLDSYLNRIQWGGSTSPTFDTLCGLLDAHLIRIPFENFDVLLGRPIRLDLAGLEAKICDAKRGGYCFEHVTLLGAVLKQLGFSINFYTARIIRAQTRSQSFRGHMFLTAEFDNRRYIIDPGFSSYAARHPIPLDETPEIYTHRMVPLDNEWALQVDLPGARFDGWITAFESETPLDFEMANHFTATHPASRFTREIAASAVTITGRVNILNQSVNFIDQGSGRRMQLPDRRSLRGVVSEYFGFDLPEIETIRVPSIPEWS